MYIRSCIHTHNIIHTCTSVLGISRSAIYDLVLVLDLQGVGLVLDLYLGASDLGISLEISSRSTLLLGKISYEKAFKIVHQSAKTRLRGTDTPREYIMYVHELRTIVSLRVYPFLSFFALAPVFTLLH